MNKNNELLSSKELAALLKRSESYVKQMKRRGFRLIGGRTTLRQAIGWLVRNPRPFAPLLEDCVLSI
jgi:DNA-binding CsgD family transcriptional regulator